MLILLLLAAAPQTNEAGLSPDMRAIDAERQSLPEATFVAKVKDLAGRDDASAIEMLGEMYRFGVFGVAPDPVKACAEFTRAAARRGDSAHNLAVCYERGDGLTANAVKAREWYRRAAALGYAKAYCALGNMMAAGAGGPRDAAGGVALCRKTAETGNADAQTDLGNFLLTGEAVPKDMVEARKWYALAAAQNQPNAAFVLAQIYWNGDGTPVDRAAAEQWWKVAYDHGRKDAAGWIAQCLFARMITKRDGKELVDRSFLAETVQWLQRAAAEDPDPDKRRSFAATLATMKGDQSP